MRPRDDPKRTLLTRPAFIFAAALTLRLATAAMFLHGEGRHMTIDSADLLTEGSEAVGIAQSLASGNGFSSPWPGAGRTAWLTPVMPAILAADMLFFGLHSRATLIVFVVFNELCSALTIFPVFFSAKRIAGGEGAARVSALAAWLFVLNPTAGVGACKLIWYTTLSAFLAASLLWATLALRNSESPAAWTGYGLLWGLQLMTHPSFLVLMPVAILWLVWGRLGTKQLTLPALACLTAVVCCVPWTVRNFAVFHHVVPLRSDFGLELWRRNHDGPPLHPNHDAEEQSKFSSLGEYAYVHEKQREALAWIGTHPGDFVGATAERVTAFWFGHGHRSLSDFVPRNEWFFQVKLVYVCALLMMVLRGLIAIRRKRREYFWLLVSFPAMFPLVYYVTIAVNSQRLPIDPVLAIIAAFAVTTSLPARRWDGSDANLDIRASGGDGGT